jgi:aerobic-type carbon monoxide dehydrogenase small subunit (CoxS/CutS family)
MNRFARLGWPHEIALTRPAADTTSAFGQAAGIQVSCKPSDAWALSLLPHSLAMLSLSVVQLERHLLQVVPEETTVIKVAIDGVVQEAQTDELLIDVIKRAGNTVPHVCYHPQLGPVQTCDTCMVEENGRLIRACATSVAEGMSISTKSAKATAAQVEAFDRILSNHLLYCTVCDNNNGNCTVHNTTKLLAIEHQKIPFRSKPYQVDNTNPFYRYDPDQCILRIEERVRATQPHRQPAA